MMSSRVSVRMGAPQRSAYRWIPWHSRGSHIRVTCRSICDCDHESWSVKIVLDHLIALFWGSWSLDFKGQNIATPPEYLRKCVDRLILIAQNSSWSLDWLQKRTWSLDSILIPVANAPTGDTYVTTPWFFYHRKLEGKKDMWCGYWPISRQHGDVMLSSFHGKRCHESMGNFTMKVWRNL